MKNKPISIKFFLLSIGIHIGLIGIFFIFESSKKDAQTNLVYFETITVEDLSLINNQKSESKIENKKVKETNIKKIVIEDKKPQKESLITEKVETIRTNQSLDTKTINQFSYDQNKKEIENINVSDTSKFNESIKENKESLSYNLNKNKTGNLENNIKKFRAYYKIGTINNPHPPYPLVARKKGWQGRLILEVSIDEKGKVKKIDIIKSSGYEILDSVSKKTLKQWKFKPAILGNKNIEDTLNIPIRFVLKN